MTELHRLSIADAGHRIASGALSPVDLVRAYLDRIEEHDGTLRSYVLVRREEAIQEAEQAAQEVGRGDFRGPLHGIPVAIKDIIDTKGIRTTCGSRQSMDNVPKRDAHVWARLKEAGAILLGKLSNHEFANAGPSLDGPFPPPLNPWDESRYPGGSSSGSGVAVAAGLCMGALGTDTGGSIRVPAALCGIAGHKPTYGLVSRSGIFPVSNSMDHCGPMAWTSEDCAIMLSAMAGYDRQDPSSAEVLVPDFASALGDRLDGLRIGLVRHFSHDDTKANDDVNAAIEGALIVLESLGAAVRDVVLPHLADFHACTATIMMAEAFSVHERDLKERPSEFTALARARATLGAFIGAADYVQAQRVRRLLAERYQIVMNDVDLIICPAMPATAITAEEAQSAQKFFILDTSPLTMPFNCVGAPAISVCCGFGNDGMPIGMQIGGSPFDDQKVLRAAHAYERATPWRDKRPIA